MRQEQVDISGYSNVNNLKPKETTKRHGVKCLRSLKRHWYLYATVLAVLAVATGLYLLKTADVATWARAEDYFTRAEYEKAAKILNNKSMPSEKNRLRVYSQTMLATGSLDKALAGYEKIYSNDKDTSAKLIIGNIHNQKKEYDKAIATYKDLIADNPNAVQAYVNLATVYRLKGDSKEAIAISEKAVTANPQNVTLLELRVSMLLEDQNSDSFRQAVEELRKVNPNDPLLESIEQ